MHHVLSANIANDNVWTISILILVLILHLFPTLTICQLIAGIAIPSCKRAVNLTFSHTHYPANRNITTSHMEKMFPIFSCNSDSWPVSIVVPIATIDLHPTRPICHDENPIFAKASKCVTDFATIDNLHHTFLPSN